jgi:hypothetical protein
VALRGELPRRYYDEPFAADEVADVAGRLTAALADERFLETARERMRSKLVALSVPAGLSRFASLDALPSLEPGSVVGRDPSIACVVRVAEDEATLEFLGNYVSGAALGGAGLSVHRNERSLRGRRPARRPVAGRPGRPRRAAGQRRSTGGGWAMSYDPTSGGAHDVYGGGMSDDDQRILRLWRESLSLLDPRYEEKQLLRIAARAMVDDAFREDFTEPEEGSEPRVRFHVNTPQTLNVVLPPRAGEVKQWPVAMRKALRSRTDRGENWFSDDWNVSDTAHDPSIVLGPGLPDGLDPGHAGDSTVPPHH